MMRIVQRSLSRRFAPFALALLIAAGAQAATVSSTLTLTGTTTISASGYVNTGQITLTNVGSGTFASTIPLTALTSSTVKANFTTGGTLFGTSSEPVDILTGGSGNASATITGGTGSFSGYQGSFPTLAGSSSQVGQGFTFNFTFTGSGTVSTSGGTTTAPPTISSVQDGASNTPNIAQGEFLSIYGTNLTPSSSGATDFPRPKSVGGVKVTFTPVAGGTGTDVYLIGVYKASGYDQINALLPSTVPVGSYNVTVTNGTVSNQFLTKVVASKPGLFTQDQSGTGLAVVFNYISQSENDVNRLTTGNYNGSLSSPAKPGQTLVAWGTGIGPYALGDNSAGVFYDFSKSEPIAAIVGGVSIPVVFAGLNQFAGEDQINFTLPANVPTGCSVTLQISVAGVLSAVTSISIAPAGATACVSSTYTTQQLVAFDQGGTITTGGFTLAQTTSTDPELGALKADSIAGSFSQISGYQLSSSGNTQSAILANSGGCVVARTTTTNSTVTAGHSTAFDAGTVTLTGPSGTNLNNQQLSETSNAYYYLFTEGTSTPGQPSGSILAGTYNVTGSGGNDVGPFSTSITIGPPLTLNNPLPTTVTESAGLTIKWTGGIASDAVLINGTSGTTTGTGTNQITTTTGFVCTTTAGQGTFTVPASILTWLPTITAAQVSAGTPAGSLSVWSSATPSSFNATLKKDGSNIPSSFRYNSFIDGLALYQ
jgi:uncharacterized protein (TIGR03437 family)